MFYKRYTFESKQTRSKRILRSSLLILLAIFMAFGTLSIYLPKFAITQNTIAQEAFYQRAPDVIAVFTGDKGRIDYTLKKAEKYPSAKVFITGVYAKNSLRTLLLKQGKGLSVEEFLEQESHHIELDYLARNTIENGLATLKYLQHLKEQNQRVLIISSDYHMYRISTIINTLQDSDSKYQFYYESIPSDYRKVINLKKLFKEIYKLAKASTFLLFWGKETPLPY